MNQVKWYEKLDPAKALMPVIMSSVSMVSLAVHWQNELMAWMAVTVSLVASLVLLIASVRRVRKS